VSFWRIIVSEAEIEKSMLENAVFQQLFLGSNRIMGKNPDNPMQLTGIGQILRRFIADLKSQLDLLKNQKLGEFLQYFEQRFNLSLKDVKERIELNFEGMGNLEGQETVVLYMVLTKLLEHLRETGYRTWGANMIKETYEQMSGKKFTQPIADKVQNLAALNEENISLLYNLSFLAFLCDSYNNKKMIVTLKRLVSIRINRIVEKLMS